LLVPNQELVDRRAIALLGRFDELVVRERHDQSLRETGVLADRTGTAAQLAGQGKRP
jgi:hypothetical protein